jgi:hypothetical protein
MAQVGWWRPDPLPASERLCDGLTRRPSDPTVTRAYTCPVPICRIRAGAR